MILEFFDNQMPEETAEDPLLQKMTDLFYNIKDNYDCKVSFMTQAVYEKDLRKLGFRDGYGSGYEDAKSEYSYQLTKKDDEITQLKAIIERLSKQSHHDSGE